MYYFVYLHFFFKKSSTSNTPNKGTKGWEGGGKLIVTFSLRTLQK